MKLNFYKLTLLIFLCFNMISFGQVVNNFDNGTSSLQGYTISGVTQQTISQHYSQCGSPSQSMPTIANYTIGTNQLNANATIVTSANETYLQSVQLESVNRVFNGNGALKLNPTNLPYYNKSTVRTSAFTIIDNILSFKFLHIGHVSNSESHPDAYFQYRVLKSNDLTELNSGCFVIEKEPNPCYYQKAADPNLNGNFIIYTPNWVNHEIDMSQFNNTQVVIEFTVTDCALMSAEDGWNHFSTAYVDNIVQYSTSQNNGSITMSPFTRLNCPTENFEVAGTYETPNCNADPVSISAFMAPFDPSNPNGTANATQIASGTFDDFSFSFDINPNTFNFIPSQDYNIFVIITFSDGSTAIGHFKYWELTFDDCTTNPDPCEDTSITITSAIPNCEDLNAFGSFPITASINLPAGYTQQDASADISANNFTLDIFDLNNSNPFAPPFLTLNSSDISNGTFGNEDMQLTFLISNAIITSMQETSYAFQFNANLNGECLVSDTVEEFSLVGCTETSVDLEPINEDCNELGDSFTLNLCGSFSTSLNDNAVLNENGLVLEVIHSSGNSQIVNASLFIPFASNEFCFTLTEADLPYGLTGNYDFRVIGTFSDDNSQSFTETDLESGINFNPCYNSDPCDAVSINITSEIPDCNIFENSSTFDICGTFTTSAYATNYNVGYTISDPGNFPFVASYQITPSNTTTNNGILTGEFCITLHEGDFDFNEYYEIIFSIGSQINGERCKVKMDPIELPFEECQTECLEITTEINGDFYCWNDIASYYEIQIISDNSCHNTNDPINEYSFETTANCIELEDILQIVQRKCFRIRIRANGCEDWNECLVGTSNVGPYFEYFGQCQTTSNKSIRSLNENSIKLHPNPAKDKFIVSSSNDELLSIEVYNIYGRIVKSHKNIDNQKLLVNINNLPEGYYFVQILTRNGQRINKKILIE